MLKPRIRRRKGDLKALLLGAADARKPLAARNYMERENFRRMAYLYGMRASVRGLTISINFR